MKTLHVDELPPPVAPARRPTRWLFLLAASLLLHVLLLTAADHGIALSRPAPASAPVVRVSLSTLSAPPAPAAASTDTPPASRPLEPAKPAPARPTRAPRIRHKPAASVARPEALASAPAKPAETAPPAPDVSVPAPDRTAAPEAAAPLAPADAPGAPDAPAAASPTAAGDTATGSLQDGSTAARATADTGAATPPGRGSDASADAATPTSSAPAASRANATAAPTPAGAASAVATAATAAARSGTADAGLAQAPPGATRQYRIDLPPSARLAYEIRYSTRGNITRGSSVIDWRTGNASYAVHGEVTKFGISLSSFRSEGAVDAAGIEPALYAEKNLRRSETNTHFQRDARRVISFSASTDAYPLVAGAQDRASILWQLSGIARGDASVLVPGATLDVFVAGVRDAEHWYIDVLGEETVVLEHGEARAWHLVRSPRVGSYDKRIDIWLAPAQQWYPVKLRYTEKSGDYLDLSLAEVH